MLSVEVTCGIFFRTKDVRGGHHDAKETVQQIVQEQQEKSQAICRVRHENHHPFEVEKQVCLQIIQGRLKGKSSILFMIILRSLKRSVNILSI